MCGFFKILLWHKYWRCHLSLTVFWSQYWYETFWWLGFNWFYSYLFYIGGAFCSQLHFSNPTSKMKILRIKIPELEYFLCVFSLQKVTNSKIFRSNKTSWEWAVPGSGSRCNTGGLVGADIFSFLLFGIYVNIWKFDTSSFTQKIPHKFPFLDK